MASLTAANSPVSASAFLRRIKWGFMEAASHWTKPFVFQFGLTALFIPRRFKDRRLGVGGGANTIKGYGPPNFSHTYIEKANSPERSAPKETSVNR